MKKLLARAGRVLALVGIAGTLLIGTAQAAAADTVFVVSGSGVVAIAGIDTIEIPTAPLGVAAIIAFLAPYAISLLNGVLPFITKSWQRKVLSVVVSLGLSGGGLAVYYTLTGDPLPADAAGWVGLGLVAIGVTQTSYNLITKQLGAKQIEAAVDSSR